MDKKNAIMLSFSDNYTYAAANLILSVRDNSPKVFEECDLIVYYDDLSEQNRGVLLKIRPGIRFIAMEHDLPAFLYERGQRTGPYIFQKFYLFDLLKDEYRRIVWLDSDIYVNGGIDYLFEVECDLAFHCYHIKDPERRRSINTKRFGRLVAGHEDRPHILNEGVIVFNDSVNRFNITRQDVCRLAEDLSTVKTTYGAIDGTVTAYIAYHYEMECARLPDEYNMRTMDTNLRDSRILHFEAPIKPWSRECLLFPSWYKNHQEYIELGGVNYPDLGITRNTFSKDGLSAATLRSLHAFRGVLGGLDIIKDPLVDVDFYNSSDCLRFGFSASEGDLFADLLPGIGDSAKIRLVMAKGLRGAHEQAFRELAKSLGEKFGDLQLGELQEGSLEIQAGYEGIDQTNRALNDLAKGVREALGALVKTAP